MNSTRFELAPWVTDTHGLHPLNYIYVWIYVNAHTRVLTHTHARRARAYAHNNALAYKHLD